MHRFLTGMLLVISRFSTVI
nr:unnamed protein product [Callosobruchus chinensis]